MVSLVRFSFAAAEVLASNVTTPSLGRQSGPAIYSRRRRSSCFQASVNFVAQRISILLAPHKLKEAFRINIRVEQRHLYDEEIRCLQREEFVPIASEPATLTLVFEIFIRHSNWKQIFIKPVTSNLPSLNSSHRPIQNLWLSLAPSEQTTLHAS
jgi:hypothetical protein